MTKALGGTGCRVSRLRHFQDAVFSRTDGVSPRLGESEAVEGGAIEIVRRKRLERNDALTVARVKHEDRVVEDTRDDDHMAPDAGVPGDVDAHRSSSVGLGGDLGQG